MARLFHPWSILAWQLAGKKGLEILNGGKGLAERDTAPAENVMTDLLAVPNAEGVATLILLDEVLMYARQRVAVDKGWLAEAELDAVLRGVFRVMIKLGVLDPPPQIGPVHLVFSEQAFEQVEHFAIGAVANGVGINLPAINPGALHERG